MTYSQTTVKKAEVISKAWTDPAYRQSLVASPKEVIAREFAVDLPAGFKVTVLEDSPAVVHLVLADPADLPDEEKTGPQAAILAKAWTDPAFKKALLADPAAALAKAFEAKILPGTAVKAVEQTADHAYIVIPARPDSLSDAELDNVAGGMSRTECENIQLGSALANIAICGVIGGPVGVAIAIPPAAIVFYQDRGTVKHDAEVIGHAASKAGHAIGHAAKKVFHGW